MCSSRAEHMSALASQGRQPEQAQDSTGHRNYWQVTFIDQPPHSHTTGGNSAARKQYLWIFSICFLTALVLVETWKGLFNYRHWLMLCCVCVGFQSAEAFIRECVPCILLSSLEIFHLVHASLGPACRYLTSA